MTEADRRQPRRSSRGLQTVVGVLAALALGLSTSAACSSDADSGDVAATTTVTPPGTTDASATTSVAQWPNRPEPCALLSDEAVREVVGFAVTAGPLSAADGGGPDTCAWANAKHGLEGGSVTVTVLPPSTDLQADRAALDDVTDLPAPLVGYTGRPPGSLGPGVTGAIVDMGDGGFALGIFTYEVRTRADVEQLVADAVGRWPAPGDAPTSTEP